MNIQHYRYVEAVSRHQNISSAARELYISQPALTRSLNQLESELGVRLFDRDASPVRLTYAGERFLTEARRILEIQTNLIQEMHSIASQESGRMVLGIPGERGSSWLPYLLPRFEAVRPGIQVDIVEAHSRELEAKMESGSIDLSLYTFPVASEAIDYTALVEEPMVIIASRDSRFASRFDLSDNTLETPYLITPDMLEGEDFLLVNPGSGMRRITEYILERHAVRFHMRRQLYRHETIVRLAAAGDGLAVTSTITPHRLGLRDRIACFSLDQPAVTRKIIAAFRKGRVLPAYIQCFIDLTRDTLHSVPELSAPRTRVLPMRLPDTEKNDRVS